MSERKRTGPVMVFVGDENTEVLAFFARHEGFVAHWLPPDGRLIDDLAYMRPDAIFLDTDALADEAGRIASEVRATASIAQTCVLALSHPPRPECDGVDDWCSKPLAREQLDAVAARVAPRGR